MSLCDTNFLQTLEGGHTGLAHLAWEMHHHWHQKTPLQAPAALLHPVGGKHDKILQATNGTLLELRELILFLFRLKEQIIKNLVPLFWV